MSIPDKDLFILKKHIIALENKIKAQDNVIQGLENDLLQTSQENDMLHKRLELYFENEKVVEITNKFSKILRWKHDIETNSFWLSDEAYEILKLDRKVCHISFEEYLKLIHPDDREYIIGKFNSSLENSGGASYQDFHCSYRIVISDGSVMYMSNDYRYEYNTIGEPVRGIGISRDITNEIAENKHKEELQQNLKKTIFRANIAEKIGKFGHVEIYLDSYSFWASEGAQAILGISDGAINSIDTFLERIHHEDRDRYLAYYTTLLSDSEDSSGSLIVRIISLDGILKYINTIFFSFDKDSNLVIGAMHDVTEIVQQQKREDELKKHLQIVDKMRSLGLLVGGITHDFNNILASIISGAEYFSLNKKLSGQERVAAENIVKAGAHATSLIKQLMAFSRQNETSNHSVDLQDVVRTSLELVRHAVDSRIIISTQFNADNVFIWTDYSRFQALILNVCINAAYALAKCEKPEIVISTDIIDSDSVLPSGYNISLADSEYALLRISNNGETIPETVIGRIFDPFFTTKKDNENSGLGLSMAFALIESMNGHILVDSSEECTSFSFYMPLADFPVANEYGVHTIVSGSGRILFVDDDENFRVNTCFFLDYLGYDVVQCSNGTEALELMSREDNLYDLAIIDMIMPDMSGAELFEQIRCFAPELKVIMLSGQIGENKIPERVAKGLTMFLNKPIHTAELSQIIHKIIP